MGAVFADFQPIETQKKRTNARFFQLVSYLIHPSEFHTIENQIRRSGVPLDILSGNPSPLRQELPVGKQTVHRPTEGVCIRHFHTTALAQQILRLTELTVVRTYKHGYTIYRRLGHVMDAYAETAAHVAISP